MLPLGLVAYALGTMMLWWSPNPSEASPYRFKSIFILGGQSNMAGRGGVIRDSWDGIVPPQCSPNPSVLRLGAGLEWAEAAEPVGADIDARKTCGVGPGMAFANAIRERDPGFGAVGLVPCAVGGTNITQWQRGTRLYAELRRRAEASLRDGGAIRAVLWYQGESDTVKRKDAESYGSKLQRFIADLRADLHAPTLLVILVVLASGQGRFVETVREAQLRVGNEVANVRCVDAKGLALDPDGLHLNTPAQAQLGEMLADSFLRGLPTTAQQHHPNSISPPTGLSFSGSPFCPGPLWKFVHLTFLASPCWPILMQLLQALPLE